MCVTPSNARGPQSTGRCITLQAKTNQVGKCQGELACKASDRYKHTREEQMTTLLRYILAYLVRVVD